MVKTLWIIFKTFCVVSVICLILLICFGTFQASFIGSDKPVMTDTGVSSTITLQFRATFKVIESYIWISPELELKLGLLNSVDLKGLSWGGKFPHSNFTVYINPKTSDRAYHINTY